MKEPHILILEDNPSAISALQSHITKMWPDAHTTIISTAADVASQINPMPADSWDAILLDYIAPDGYFHVLDFDKFGPDKIVAISNTEAYNQLAMDYGVTHAVRKSYSDLDSFAETVVGTIKQMLQ